MTSLNYEGVLEAWKVRLIEARAKRLGFEGADIDDAMQDCVLELVQFKFQPEKANGATEKTVVYAVVDRILRTLRQRRVQQATRFVGGQKWGGDRGIDVSDDGAEIAAGEQKMDLAAVTAELPESAQALCRLLSDGLSLSEAAQRLGWKWREVEREAANIRRHFSNRGL